MSDRCERRSGALLCRSYLVIRSAGGAAVDAAVCSSADAVVLDLTGTGPGDHDLRSVLDALHGRARAGGTWMLRVDAEDGHRWPAALARRLPAGWRGADGIVLRHVRSAHQIGDAAATLADLVPGGGVPGLEVEPSPDAPLSAVAAMAAAIGPDGVLHCDAAMSARVTIFGLRLVDIVPDGADSRPPGAFCGRWIDDPSAADGCNALFTPSADQVRRAMAILDACAAAERDTLPAVVFDGRIVDVGAIRRAERIVAMDAAIRARTSVA